MVQRTVFGRLDAAVGVADPCRSTVYYSGVRHPQTQGKVERFHRAL
jgi:hypothetical protein